jgi:hypothetical protein
MQAQQQITTATTTIISISTTGNNTNNLYQPTNQNQVRRYDSLFASSSPFL